jgi:hypothetical protein
MPKRVLVLGCGPAGLIAAHAAEEAGFVVSIAAKARPSRIFGAQYLHAPIPGIDPGEPRMIEYQLVGEAEDYRDKVYGDLWDGVVSGETLTESHYAWDIRHTYGKLWARYGNFITDIHIKPKTIHRMLQEEIDLIVSTIPSNAICSQGHSFRSQQIWAAGDAPELGIEIPYQCPSNKVICNGDKDISWYRLSNIFEHKTVEWPIAIKPPVPTSAVVEKPLTHNCTCFHELLRVGRYGAWKKGYLVHEVYSDVQTRLLEV